MKWFKESFADARIVAECIAKSAGVKLGDVQIVTQGLFTIVRNINQLHESDYFGIEKS